MRIQRRWCHVVKKWHHLLRFRWAIPCLLLTLLLYMAFWYLWSKLGAPVKTFVRICSRVDKDRGFTKKMHQNSKSFFIMMPQTYRKICNTNLVFYRTFFLCKIGENLLFKSFFIKKNVRIQYIFYIIKNYLIKDIQKLFQSDNFLLYIKFCPNFDTFLLLRPYVCIF